VRVLAEVSQAFAAATDYQVLLEKIARTTADLVGDGCSVTLLDGDGDTLFNAANAHRDPALEADYRHFLTGMRIPRSTSAAVSAWVARTGVPRIAEVLPAELVERADAPLKPLVVRLNVHAFAVVPIRARQTVIGTLSLVRSGPGRAYTDDDRALVEDLAERAGLAMGARLLADLRLAVRARDEFLSIASHELKTPLTPLELLLATATELVRRARSGVAELPLEKLETKLVKAAKQVERLTLLVNNLLGVTRITAGRLTLVRREVDLCAMVQAVVERMEEMVRSSGSRVTIHAGAPVGGTWDPGGVESVVSNLIANAVKYGGGNPIDVELEPAGDVVRLSVTDRGIGIAPEDLERIFERFERAVPGEHYGGFGIGLWVCRQVVLAHGGAIRVSSTHGVGSTFFVELSGRSNERRRDGLGADRRRR
jgi:signal transduction histidine kinase